MDDTGIWCGECKPYGTHKSVKIEAKEEFIWSCPTCHEELWHVQKSELLKSKMYKDNPNLKNEWAYA